MAQPKGGGEEKRNKNTKSRKFTIFAKLAENVLENATRTLSPTFVWKIRRSPPLVCVRVSRHRHLSITKHPLHRHRPNTLLSPLSAFFTVHRPSPCYFPGDNPIRAALQTDHIHTRINLATQLLHVSAPNNSPVFESGGIDDEDAHERTNMYHTISKDKK